MSRLQKQILFFLTLAFVGIASRLVPHAANFVPITALALLAAAYLPRRLALTVPLTVMIVSDLLIGMHDTIAYTWGSFVLIGYLGSKLYARTGKRWHVAAMAPIGSVVFFVISNFGVWAQGNMYAHNLAGLERCYIMALPFFRATLTADVLYTPLVFLGAYFALKAVQNVSAAKPVVAHA